ncbi:MAG: hypothetical protein U0236_13780 [Nitrospira sp.]
MDGEQNRRALSVHWQVWSKQLPMAFCLVRRRGLLVFLAGCQSTQDVYLAQATDHATTKELERILGHPSHEQVLETGRRCWLYRREDGTESRDFTPYCQDLWLRFDQEGVLRKWQKQRC